MCCVNDSFDSIIQKCLISLKCHDSCLFDSREMCLYNTWQILFYVFQFAQLDTLALDASCTAPVKTTGIAIMWRVSVFVRTAGQDPTAGKVKPSIKPHSFCFHFSITSWFKKISLDDSHTFPTHVHLQLMTLSCTCPISLYLCDVGWLPITSSSAFTRLVSFHLTPPSAK